MGLYYGPSRIKTPMIFNKINNKQCDERNGPGT